jgi:glycosyltransferase involved in cell wall biosynthesis
MDDRKSPLAALLVDPALFTGPYDAALTRGLEAAGVRVRWAARPLRAGEAPEVLDAEPIYYRGVQDTAKGRGAVRKLRKAASHALGGLRLLRLAQQGGFDLVHFQWAVAPLYDAWVMRRLARLKPVVLTVHDLEPFNHAPTSRLQTLGFGRVLRAASRIIVHTPAVRDALLRRGEDPGRVVVVPHGPLTLAVPPAAADPRPGVWRLTLFGKLQKYKGVDLLIEALGRLAPEQRARLAVVIAGEPLIPMETLSARIAELGLDSTVKVRPYRLSEDEMAALFAETDAFVFPYRHIAASGVLHLVLPYRRWIVASDLGEFQTLIADGRNGRLVPTGAPDTLADALLESIGRQPDPTHRSEAAGWDEIGRRTRAVYEDALAQHALRLASQP